MILLHILVTLFIINRTLTQSSEYFDSLKFLQYNIIYHYITMIYTVYLIAHLKYENLLYIIHNFIVQIYTKKTVDTIRYR